MSNFRPFADAVAAQFARMAKEELFHVKLSGEDLWDVYLGSFPEGTNTIFRTRTHHDGSYDRNFIRRIGNVVSINKKGTLDTIWDSLNVPAPYDVVTKAMADAVRSSPLVGLLRINPRDLEHTAKEFRLGYVSTYEKLPDGTVHTWNHFNAIIPQTFVTKDVGTVKGDAESSVAVIRRSLQELDSSAVQTVVDLIDDKALYRGEEFRKTLTDFLAAQKTYKALNTPVEESIFLWKNYQKGSLRVRNTAIGTLLVDLTEGKDLEGAVKSYEAKVAPANYKRPTAVITKRQVEDALTTIRELNLEPALERRFANISDVSVNNVLWVDNSVISQMKDGLSDLLMGAVKRDAVVADSKAVDIGIDEFMSTILPKSQTLEVLFSNKFKSSLMSVTAPVHENSEAMFKWNNGFAWSYNGNITDSEIRQAVVNAGGRVDGVFRFSHSWNHEKRNASLMDLHVFMPANKASQHPEVHDTYGNDERVGWNNRTHRASGGVQDVDYTAAAPVGYVPVENITFPDLSRMPEGQYVCKIHNWQYRRPTEGGFKAEIEFDGNVFEYNYDRPLKNHEWVVVAVVTLKDGQFTIDHKIPHTASSQRVWGVNTEQFVKVKTVLNSPNYWDENAVGNKHWFFILEGCANDEPTRGIYNEFLKPELEKHRRVFEVLGNKTKCPVVPNQLSGLGFSSTKRETVVVRATGSNFNRVYKINF